MNAPLPLAVTYAADTESHDRELYAAAAVEEGGQVRVRAALTIYRDQQYQGWPGQSWMLRATADEACATRDALKAFFAAVERKGPGHVLRLLELA